MISTATAQAAIRDLSDKLTKRLAGNSGLNTVVLSADANGWPVLTISHNGTVTEGSPVLAIRIKGIDAVSKDVFGNSTYAYAPHECDFAYEVTSGGLPEIAAADMLTCFYETEKIGCAMTIKEIANGTAVTPASVEAAPAKTVLAPLYWRQASV